VLASPDVSAPDSNLNGAPMVSLTTLALVSIAFCVIATVLVMARRAARVDLSGITVSRQWLTQHQSHDRS
jgi:hypothetical protein